MAKTVAGQGTLKIGGVPMKVAFNVPAGPCSAQAVLPDVQRFANQITDHAVAVARREGRTVSCAKGCGACCRQMVPITPPEARHLARLIAAMPPARALAIKARFADARAKMAERGVRPGGHPDAAKPAYREFGLAYFRTGVPCPFLEDESCSIHPDRPLVCREYLVTSPPAARAVLGSGQVRQLPIPVRVWAAFGRSAAPDAELQWMPLIDALSFVESHPAPPSDRTGPQRVEAFFKEITC